jgi:hypothetical protein
MSDAAKQRAEPSTPVPAGPHAQTASQEPLLPGADVRTPGTFGFVVGTCNDTGDTVRRAAADHRRQALLGLQRMAGNAAVGRLLARRRSAIRSAATIQRAPALAADDYAALAQHLHEAMAGWGTDEEAIYVSLQKLGKDATAIAALKKAYKDAYSSDLESDIRDEMSGGELDLALELLGAGSGTGATVGAVPATDADYKAAAKKLHTAMEGWGTDEEAIYAALVPFNRDAAKLTKLKTVYKTEYGSELEADIRDEMSSDELAYALYLLNAPPAATPTATTTVTAAGTEQHTGKVPGGDVSVHTGANMTVGGTPMPDTFSVGYKGGLAPESGWIQFIWSEVVATQADGSELYVAASGLGTSNGTMDLTTDPSAPKYKVDTATTTSPFYESGGVSIRTATGTTIYDRPAAFSSVINSQFDAGATKVVERDHFDQFLIRDYKTIYHTSVVVQWVYTTKTTVARSTTAGGGGKVDGMPSALREQLIKEFPSFDYIQ